jgi:hypothetical protein
LRVHVGVDALDIHAIRRIGALLLLVASSGGSSGSSSEAAATASGLSVSEDGCGEKGVGEGFGGGFKGDKVAVVLVVSGVDEGAELGLV